MVYKKVKLELIFSFPLNSLYNKDFNVQDIERVRNETEDFRSFIDKNSEKIFNLIKKYCGYDWTKRYIPVYICENFPREAISEPMILKIDSDKNWMIHLIIHELVHENIPSHVIIENMKRNNLFIPGHQGLEIIISHITEKILLEFLTEKEVKKIIVRDIKNDVEHKSVWNKSKKLKLDINNKSLSEIF